MATPPRPQPDAIIASEWGGWVHDSVVYRCTSTTRPSSPQEGMTVYELDTNALKVYAGATTGWVPPWNLPWGVVGYATLTATQNVTGSDPVDVTHLSVEFTALPGRLYRTEAMLGIVSNTGGPGTIALFIRDHANVKKGQANLTVNAGSDGTLEAVSLELGLTGPTTRKASFVALSGAAVIAAGPGTGAECPAFITVTDLGPVGNPT